MSLRPVLIVPPADLRCRTERIVARVARQGIGCVHLEHHPIGFVCWQHPAMVRCADCAECHIATHSHAVEFSCDVCGGHLDGPGGVDNHLALMHRVEIDTTVAIGRGRRAAVGLIYLTGWGACPTCSSSIDKLEMTS